MKIKSILYGIVLLIIISNYGFSQTDYNKLKAEKKEQNRFANLNNLGIWSIHYYVDEFGESTNKGYITNTSFISGTFSNSATQDSKLNVRFLISDSSNISIKLFEYADSNPVKPWSGSDSYNAIIQDKDGNRLKLKAINSSDRLRFNKKSSRRIHNALIKGGNVKMRIYEYNNKSTNYLFSIQNVDWYENAYRKLINP